MSAKQAILDRLARAPGSLAIHEFNLIGYSQNNIATRLNELEREGKLVSQFRRGEHFKEWSLKPQESRPIQVPVIWIEGQAVARI